MLLSALDPALLIYDQEHWQTRQIHCFSRLKALALHRSIIRKYSQRIVMSHELASVVCESFPWNNAFKTLAQLRDLRQFVFEDMNKARYVNVDVPGQVSLEPAGFTCEYVAIPTILSFWERLLRGCVEEEISSEFDVQIATWETPTTPELPHSMTVTINNQDGPETHYIPVVWDESSWSNRLASQDSWPDLPRCVELYFLANRGMQDFSGVRDQPIPFDCTDRFWKSIDDFCQQPWLRHALVKALTKKVYGILDASLHDEPLGQIRRFRVTSFWRVHYRDLGNAIVLEEFGEHDIGI